MTHDVTPDAIAEQTKLALRRFARSVAIITTFHQGQRFAMAATAVSELSLSPAAMLVCVNRSASLHAALTVGAPFCINLLGASQTEISQACGGRVRGEARFEHGSWSSGALGVPVLDNAQANLVCLTESSTDYGSHTIFIGRIVEVVTGGDVDPLVYVDGQYSRVGYPQAA